jgi:hypothetical protein
MEALQAGKCEADLCYKGRVVENRVTVPADRGSRRVTLDLRVPGSAVVRRRRTQISTSRSSAYSFSSSSMIVRPTSALGPDNE